MRVYTAFEDAITDLIPKTQELYAAAKNKPKFSPAEIDACFPDLYKTEAHTHAMRRVASQDKSPEGKHIVAVCDYIPILRGASYYDAWRSAKRTFPGVDAKELRQYIIDTLVLWCSPCRETVGTAEDLIREGDFYLQEIYERWKEIRKDPSIVSNQIESLKETERYAKERFAKTQRIDDEAELTNVSVALDELKTIKYILNGNYLGAWSNIARTYEGYSAADTAAHFIEVMRVFKL